MSIAFEFKADAKPSINFNHVDGPLLYSRLGGLHWLTWWERFRVWTCAEDAYSLERKHFPRHIKAWDRASLEHRMEKYVRVHNNRFGAKHSVKITHGVQTFTVFDTDDTHDAKFMKKMLCAALAKILEENR